MVDVWRRSAAVAVLAGVLAACGAADSAAPETTSVFTLSGIPSTVVASSTSSTEPATTTTTEVDLRAIPGRHLDEIPESETVRCPLAKDVPIVGDPMVLTGFENRPTALQRTADPSAPLLVIFHGQHGCIQNVQSRSDLDVIGAPGGVHVLWLSGAPVPTRSWRVSNGCCSPASDRDIDDMPYVEAALQQVAALGLSPRRTIAVGVSNGGGMAISAACWRPDLFDAAASVAGWAATSCDRAPQSLLVFGGSEDVKLGSRTAANIASMWRQDVVACTAEPVVETFERRTTSTWSGCEGGATVRLVQLDGVPHVWPKFTFYDMDDDLIWFAKGKYDVPA